MKNFALALGALALLAACSSEPSDFRPDQKVSVDVVYAGGRKTGLYPSNDKPAAHGTAAEGHGDAHAEGHTQGHPVGEIHPEAAAHQEPSAEGHPAAEDAGAEPVIEVKH